MNNIYSIGSLVVYGNEGVCSVDEIGCPDISSINKNRTYYTLSPLYRDGKIYTPIDTENYIRPVISYDQAQSLIKQIPDIKTNETYDTNVKVLSIQYQELIQSYKCEDLLQLIKTVYEKKRKLTNDGKKLGQVDERYMKSAEEFLFGEFAVALNIPKSEVKSYIESMVDSNYSVKE